MWKMILYHREIFLQPLQHVVAADLAERAERKSGCQLIQLTDRFFVRGRCGRHQFDNALFLALGFAGIISRQGFFR